MLFGTSAGAIHLYTCKRDDSLTRAISLATGGALKLRVDEYLSNTGSEDEVLGRSFCAQGKERLSATPADDLRGTVSVSLRLQPMNPTTSPGFEGRDRFVVQWRILNPC